MIHKDYDIDLTRRNYGKTTFTWILVRIGDKWQSSGDPLPKIQPSAKDLDEAIKRAEKYSAIEAENDVQKIQIEKMKKEKNQMISELIEGFRNGNCGIRTICFNDNRSDPYVLFHHSAEELSDERLDELYSEWQEANETPEENEQFESFLAWLEADKGFSYLPVVDAMKMF